MLEGGETTSSEGAQLYFLKLFKCTKVKQKKKSEAYNLHYFNINSKYSVWRLCLFGLYHKVGKSLIPKV